jgi:zinc transport system ATP-binding protein
MRVDRGADGPLVEGRRLRLRFGGHEILQGIDVSVRAGEIVTVIGPNGAGKSMMARALLGLVALDGGTVARRPGLTVGYLPQRFAVDAVLPLTVRRLMSLTQRASASSIATALDEVGAAHLLSRQVHDLSGGELQRVLLARALLGDPDLLVLDEPIQGVDVTGQMELYGLIARLRDRHGCGILLISHDLHLVMAATDRVVCINHHLCCEGKPEAVRSDPAYLALFGAQAAQNLAVYTHAHDHSHDLAGEVVGPGHEHGHDHAHHHPHQSPHHPHAKKAS